MRSAVASRNTHILDRLPEVTSPKASRKPAEGGKTSAGTRRVAAPPDPAIISNAIQGGVDFQRNEEPGGELIPRTPLGRTSRSEARTGRSGYGVFRCFSLPEDCANSADTGEPNSLFFG